MADVLLVRPSRLEGTIAISGAKNSALRLLAASILTSDDILLENAPTELIDFKIHIQMLELLGKSCEVHSGQVKITEGHLIEENLNWQGQSIRNTLLIFGALLARLGRASVPLPGGCTIGERKYDLHQLVLESLGATIWEESGCLYGEAPKGLVGAEIHLPLRSTGATENGIIAGSLSSGTTTIWNPHLRPEILDLIAMLRSMGARIEVYGQERIVIHGSSELRGSHHRVIPDNVEAMTYLVGAAITHGDVEIKNFPFDHLEVPLIHLRESGVRFFRGKDNLIVKGGATYPVEISTGPYPGINSDMQPLFAVFGLTSPGESRITDLRFPDRFAYALELQKIGGNLQIRDNLLILRGGNTLQGTDVTALDLRCGAALVLAGLIADGETRIYKPDQIHRGYENIDTKLRSLGAQIDYDCIQK